MVNSVDASANFVEDSLELYISTRLFASSMYPFNSTEIVCSSAIVFSAELLALFTSAAAAFISSCLPVILSINNVTSSSAGSSNPSSPTSISVRSSIP